MPLTTLRVPQPAIVLMAGVVHLLLLGAPIVVVTGPGNILSDSRAVIFMFVASAWFFAESVVTSAEYRLPLQSHGPRFLPFAIGGGLLITYWFSLAESVLSQPRPIGIVAVAGVAVMVVGIALRTISIQALGKYFLNDVAIVPDQPLVTQGIYGVFRHPSETGTLCLAFGGTMVLGSTIGMIAAALLLLPCVIWRTRLEDKMLRKQYDLEFDGYEQAVPAFLPRSPFYT